MTERIFDVATAMPRSMVGLIAQPWMAAPTGFERAARAGERYELLTGLASAVDLREIVTIPPSGVVAAAEGRELFDVAVDFALHLTELRGPHDCVVVSERRPTDDSETLGFPHLVSIRRPPREVIWWEESGALTPVPNYLVLAGPVVDVILWELMPLTQLHGFGLEEACVRRWRERLPVLLEHRRKVRGGEADPRLLRALGRRYLSFRFVCEHASLLDEISPTADASRASRP